MLSRYIWRGQSWGGNYPVIQPTIKYSISKKLKAGLWASTNFKGNYFYENGDFYKGYQELDLFVMYNPTKYLSIQVWDYYWPTVSKVQDIDNHYFNYSDDGVKTLDCSLNFDFKDYGFPLTFVCSTLVAGNDFKYDDQGENPKQNFTTYLEAGYVFPNPLKKYKVADFLKEIEFSTAIGIVLNNQAEYYTAGDYNKPSWVNLSVKAKKEIAVSSHFKVPVQLNYIHNAAVENTQTFGRNFVVFSTGIYY